VDVYLVIRDAEETFRWMNLTRYLTQRPDKTSRQIVFDGEKLDFEAVCGVLTSLTRVEAQSRLERDRIVGRAAGG
jgi:hypothetical protein